MDDQPRAIAGPPITLQDAKDLRPGQLLYQIGKFGSDGRPIRWMVNGKPKTWKTMPEKVRVPLKHGLYTYTDLTHEDLEQVSLTQHDTRSP